MFTFGLSKIEIDWGIGLPTLPKRYLLTPNPNMTIVENSILHLTTLLFFLAGFGGLVLSILKKSQLIGQLSFGTLIVGCLQILFIGLVNGTPFVLSPKVDYGYNYIFTLSSAAIAIVSIWALLVYYRHKGIPPIIHQFGLFFSAVIIGVTFFSVIEQKMSKRVAKKSDKIRFMKAEDFQKGSPEPELSKVPADKDSVPKQ